MRPNLPALKDAQHKIYYFTKDLTINGITVGRGAGNISFNTAVGALSLKNNTIGVQNTAVGYDSLQGNTTGSANTGIGYGSLSANRTGSNNASLGYFAGSYMPNGTTPVIEVNNSIYIGYNTKASAASGVTNETVIGYTAVGLGNNTTVIGNSSVIATTIYGGLKLPYTTDATNNTTGGALTVAGGAAIAKQLYVGTNLTIGGNLTVNGFTTTVNSSTITVDDKNLELGSVAAVTPTGSITAGSAVVSALSSTANIIVGSAVSPVLSGAGTVTLPASVTVLSIDSATQITLSAAFTGTGSAPGATLSIGGATDVTANGGGITLTGATNKTIIWDSTNTNWTSSEHWNIATGKSYKINNVTVLDNAQVLASATGVTVGGTSTTTIGLGTNSTTLSTTTVGGAITGNVLKIAGTAAGTVNLTSDVTTGTINEWTNITTATINIGASTGTIVANGTIKLPAVGSSGYVTIGAGGQLGTGTPGATVTATTTNATFYPIFSSATTGLLTIANVVTSGFRFNPFTNVLTLGGDASINSIIVGKGAGGVADNTAVGDTALNSNTTGSANTAVGYSALATNTTSNWNTAVGTQSLFSTTARVISITISAGGTGYTPTAATLMYTNVQLTYVSGSTAITYPTANITVTNGAVTSCTLLTYGTGFKNSSTVMSADSASIGGTGSGLLISIGSVASSDSNVAVGYKSLYANIGSSNTAVGASALFNNTVANNNTAIGYQSMYTATASTGNVAIGALAMYSTTTGIGAFGTITGGTGYTPGTYKYVTLSGLYGAVFGSYPIVNITVNATGNVSACALVTPGSYAYSTVSSTAFTIDSASIGGTGSGFSILASSFSSGSSNTAIGFGSLQNNTIGGNNTASGYSSLQKNTTGIYNTAIGSYSLQSNITGASNIAIGFQSLYKNTTGVSSFGTITGGSGYTGTGTYYNVQLTPVSGSAATTYPTANITVSGGQVTSCTLVSNGSGFKDTSTVMTATASLIGGGGSGFLIPVSSISAGNYNVSVGALSLYANTLGQYNQALGYQSLFSNTAGGYNISVGANSLLSNTTGNNNVVAGHSSMYTNTAGSNNTAVGFNALYNNTTVTKSSSILSGGTGYTGTGTYSNVQLTYVSGSAATTYPTANITVSGGAVTACTFVTYGSGFKDTSTVMTATASLIGGAGSGFLVGPATLFSGDSNVSIGSYSLNANTIGQNNTASGQRALQANTTGSNNVATGTSSMFSNTSGSSNVAIGVSSLQANLTSDNNIAIGNGAAQAALTGPTIAIGAAALNAVSSGTYNLAIGDGAGRYLTNGNTQVTSINSSTYLGHTTRASAAAGVTNETVIGYNAIGSGSNTVTIGNSSVLSTIINGNITTTTTAISAAAWTTAGVNLKLQARTYTDTSSLAGTVASSYINAISAPTFASTNAITITDAANLYVAAPVAGTNSTLTNAWSILATGKIKAAAFIGDATGLTYTGASVRPSLLLNFANTKRLDKRITFARASIATRYNQDGLIEVVATNQPRFDHDPITKQSLGLLMEEQRQNLLKCSEPFFDNTVWGKANCTIVPNAAVAPDGTFTASKIILNSGSPYGYLASYGGLSANTTYTLSYYAKAAEFTETYPDIFTNGASDIQFKANLSTGGKSNVAGSPDDYGVVPVGNGWYRCYITRTFSSGFDMTNNQIQIGRMQGTGNGTSGIYIWGAQLEAFPFMSSYIPSSETFTSRASFGSYYDSTGLIKYASANAARYTYNPANLKLAPKLLLETSSANLFYYSEQFDNTSYWTTSAVSFTANATVAPDGTTTADKMTETVTGSAIQHLIVQSIGTVSVGSVYTSSIYAKAGERTCISVTANAEAYIVFDLVAGTIFQGASQATMTAVGNGWYRCCATFTKTNTNGSFYYVNWDNAGGGLNNYIGTVGSGLFIWGAQVESGAIASSYIKTASSTVNRSADLYSASLYTRIGEFAAMTGTNFLNWYRQDEGTLHATSRLMSTTTAVSVPTMAWVDTGAGGAITLISLRYVSGSGGAVIDSYGYNNSVSQWDLNGTAVTSQTVISCALAYATNDIALSVSGNTVETDTSAAVGQGMSRMLIGSNQNLHILKLAYYPKRLTNAELQSITTQ
jgi:hypothetical protein